MMKKLVFLPLRVLKLCCSGKVAAGLAALYLLSLLLAGFESSRSSGFHIEAEDPDIRTVLLTLNVSSPGVNASGIDIDLGKLPLNEVIKYNRSLFKREFSSYVSALIPVDRALPDVRLKECERSYEESLPMSSVVIIFRNEHWSTLLRTLNSILRNSPEKILKEILLVDDASDEGFLKQPLDNYVRNMSKVRVIRSAKRQGLMKVRNLGFKMSSAPVVIFMDSHCECFPGWLEPLVKRIAENERVVVTPVIHFIRHMTFDIRIFNTGKELMVPYLTFPNLFFEWRLNTKRVDMPRKEITNPVVVPAMVGCVIGVSRTWFETLGMFDPGMEIWGGENTELSLKTWLCGGRLEIMPCSNVGHVHHPHKHTPERRNAYLKNIARVANVWLDDYKNFTWNYNGSDADFGDVTDRLAIRNDLGCKGFEVYISMFPEMYIFGDGIFSGDIRSYLNPNMCVDAGLENYIDRPNIIIPVPCHGIGGNQMLEYSEVGEIRHTSRCLDAGFFPEVGTLPCHGSHGNQQWEISKRGPAYHIENLVTSSCLTLYRNMTLGLSPCTNVLGQFWLWRRRRKSRKSHI